MYGNLYLAEKTGARGRTGEGFTAEDEELPASMAASAAVAIDNARLFQDAHRREAWQAASTEITRAQLDGDDADAVLRLIAERAGALSGGETTLLMLPDSVADVLRVRSAVGRGTAHLTGRPIPLEGSLAGPAATSGRPLISEDVSKDGRVQASSAGPWPWLEPGMVVPFADGDATGSMLVARERGRTPFTEPNAWTRPSA